MDIDTDIQENACGDRGRDYSGVSAKQDCWWPPEAEGGRKDPRRVFRGSTALPTLDVGCLASRTGRQHMSVVSNHSVCGPLLGSLGNGHSRCLGLAKAVV